MGLESLNPWIAGAQAVGGLVKGAIGVGQNIKANKMLRKLKYPTEVIPSAIKQNKTQAEIDANVGTPSEQYNKSMKDIQRNQLLALSRGREGRFGLGLVAALNDNSNQAIGELDAEDAQNRIINKRNLQSVNNNYGQWQDKVWQNNIKDKYQRDYDYAMSLKGAGNTNVTSGIDSLLAAGGTALSGGMGRSAAGQEAEPIITNYGTGAMGRTATWDVMNTGTRPATSSYPTFNTYGRYVRRRPNLNFNYYQ